MHAELYRNVASDRPQQTSEKNSLLRGPVTVNANQTDDYREAICADITACLEEKGGQPILFLGSGVSQRYFDAPDWRGLLTVMAEKCPEIRHDLAYYEQSYESLRHIGKEFATKYKEWAWSKARKKFPEEYFNANYPQAIFLKHAVSEYLKSITPSEPTLKGSSKNARELKRLQQIRPHAIVTTNYDEFIERLFPEYEPIVGQRILSSDSAFVGEVFKIHGCVSQPRTLVLTVDDYQDFQLRKKYLSAKLLTFFLEHPVLLVGYSAEDPNIRAILSDIDIILSADGELIPNIFLLRRTRAGEPETHLPREVPIPVGEDRHVRIHMIVASDFDWVFDAFSLHGSMERIRPKLLRGLLARTYDLVRVNIPKHTMEVDYSVLERAVESESELAKLYGITVVGDATHVNVGYPYSLTAVGRELGHKTWHPANKLLQHIIEKTGKDLKQSDNKYHVAVKAGESTIIRKYSPLLVDLLKRVQDDPEASIEVDI